MNEIFNFNRFWTYFKYDLKQMWRNHSKAAILIGGSSAIFYVIWLLCSLVFTQHWSTPPIAARFIVFVVAFGILELYQVRTYGFLTEKKAGSAWLMIPASKAEKYVSMLLITLIVIPLLFVAVYFLIDGFLSLVDPTVGKALLAGAAGVYQEFLDGIITLRDASPITFSTSGMIAYAIVGFFCNLLYFLLCGICFKKNKLVTAIAILFGISLLFSLLSGLFLPRFIQGVSTGLDEMKLAEWTVRMMNISVVVTCLVTIGLAWGVWRRIKTIQH